MKPTANTPKLSMTTADVNMYRARLLELTKNSVLALHRGDVNGGQTLQKASEAMVDLMLGLYVTKDVEAVLDAVEREANEWVKGVPR
jgi:hypothetical protein